jgi:hypothetical protein
MFTCNPDFFNDFWIWLTPKLTAGCSVGKAMVICPKIWDGKMNNIYRVVIRIVFQYKD